MSIVCVQIYFSHNFDNMKIEYASGGWKGVQSLAWSVMEQICEISCENSRLLNSTFPPIVNFSLAKWTEYRTETIFKKSTWLFALLDFSQIPECMKTQ